uniref:Uncharacterized protein n=2 Tax=viral metagenome TaxID=1070528 RepID=A0A6H1ZTJ6_9ZZZZ
MKAKDLVFGQRIKYGSQGKYSTNYFWRVMGVDMQDRRFCYIKSEKNGKMKRILVSKLLKLGWV